jgi:hypothetical protein
MRTKINVFFAPNPAKLKLNQKSSYNLTQIRTFKLINLGNEPRRWPVRGFSGSRDRRRGDGQEGNGCSGDWLLVSGRSGRHVLHEGGRSMRRRRPPLTQEWAARGSRRKEAKGDSVMRSFLGGVVARRCRGLGTGHHGRRRWQRRGRRSREQARTNAFVAEAASARIM